MLAFMGFIFWHHSGAATHNFGELNSLNVLTAVPQWGLVQIVSFIGGVDGQRYLKCTARSNAASRAVAHSSYGIITHVHSERAGPPG